jgi:hypothetical protein
MVPFEQLPTWDGIGVVAASLPQHFLISARYRKDTAGSDQLLKTWPENSNRCTQ